MYNLRVSHSGYQDFLVERNFLINKNLTILEIIDKLNPCINKKDSIIPTKINLYFHLSPKINLRITNQKVTINNDLEIEFNCNKKFKIEIIDTFYSPMYGIKCKSQTINLEINKFLKRIEKVEIRVKIHALN